MITATGTEKDGAYIGNSDKICLDIKQSEKCDFKPTIF